MHELDMAVEYTDWISAELKDMLQWLIWYEVKQSDRAASVTLEFWERKCTLSFPLLPGPLWPGVEAPDWLLSMGQVELFDIYIVCKQMIYTKLIF